MSLLFCVDDIAVHSNEFDQHLVDLEKFLQVIKYSAFTLNINKYHFAQSKVKFVGHIIGSGERSPDLDLGSMDRYQILTRTTN